MSIRIETAKQNGGQTSEHLKWCNEKFFQNDRKREPLNGIAAVTAGNIGNCKERLAKTSYQIV